MNRIYQKTFPGEKNAGFTLIELLVVVLIIGILAAVALPKYEQAVLKTQWARLMATVRPLQTALEAYYLANGIYPNDTLQGLDLDITGCVEIGSGQLKCDGNLRMDYNGGASYADRGFDMIEAIICNSSGAHVVRALIYLPHSKTNPGQTFCIGGTPARNRLCKSLGGVATEGNNYLLP